MWGWKGGGGGGGLRFGLVAGKRMKIFKNNLGTLSRV